MSIERTKRGFDQDSDDEASPPAKCQAPDMPSEPQPSTSKQSSDDDSFQLQGREYLRARKSRLEEKKKQESNPPPTQPKEQATSRQQSSDVPRILVPATSGFQSPVDVAEDLEATLNLRGKLPMKFLHSGQVLLSPPTMALHDAIMSVKNIIGNQITLQSTVSSNVTKGVLKYPLLMPLSIVQRHPQVLSVERLSLRDGESTRQLLGRVPLGTVRRTVWHTSPESGGTSIQLALWKLAGPCAPRR
ncbi:uncharacterized protein LOC123509825 [Portunus trituberculatus]|uniref:uncharacterized protein LOC123509825 n=1 Tax=Portunus trituberculatus TaxID=210409 RepID=UPI001E1CF504|nr:uncharacterized protein LOC123509825 [Portunus trituberculatus]